MRADGALIYRPPAQRPCRTKLLCNRGPVRVLRGSGRVGRAVGPAVGVRYEGLYVRPLSLLSTRRAPTRSVSIRVLAETLMARSYVVERWSLRAVPPAAAPVHRRGSSGSDAGPDPALQYTFTLVRAHPEPPTHASSVPLALRHPDAAEREAWAEYVAARAEHVVEAGELVRGGWRGELVWMERGDGDEAALESEGGWPERRDSGYAEGTGLGESMEGMLAEWGTGRELSA